MAKIEQKHFDLPSDLRVDTNTYLTELIPNSILCINNINYSLYQVFGFDHSRGKTHVFARNFLLHKDGCFEYLDLEKPIPDLNVRHIKDAYIAYTRHESSIRIIGQAGIGNFSRLPVLRKS